MKKTAWIWLGMGVLAEFIGFGIYAGAEVRYELVYIEDLVGSLESFDGKPVRTIGYVRADLGAYGIFPSEEGGIQSENGLWLELPEDLKRSSGEFNKQFCLLEGVVNIKNRGRMGRWKASIEDITKMEIWG